jgi:hypothetical protein
MLAAEMRCGKAPMLAQEISEMHSRLDVGRAFASVDRQ